MTSVKLECDGMAGVWERALAASLPASVQWAERDGDVVLIGRQDGWAARLRARMEAGQRRFIVIDPQVGAAGQLSDTIAMAERIGAHIVLCETHADNPAVAPFRVGLNGTYAAATITGQGEAPMGDLVLQQLRLARAAGFAPDAVLHAAADARRALATVQAHYGEDSALLRLTAVYSRAGEAHHRLMLHGRTESASLHLWSDPLARPGQAFHICEQQTTEQPTIYESAHRAALRRLSAASDPVPAGAVLRQWDHDACLAMVIAGAG
ncbi:hypothetical protein FHW96_001481 [Novosphingobium sp. SG751A]|uniref:hypothetical protein n=1 Tax=Novosphingobium sp. SG751A TaxID=2587000 RepID=UPI0015523E8F|nr:hypothetical protein [Novosphingobium sp. SG751A]NOW45326.1 hypothetical protein [Novosphingobium sp. SG751A]